MAERSELLVHIAYDDEADVWYISKSDIPGLSLEAATPPELLKRVVECVPELLALNHGLMTKVVSAALQADAKPASRSAARASRSRPWAVRPVFDTPLMLASA